MGYCLERNRWYSFPNSRWRLEKLDQSRVELKIQHGCLQESQACWKTAHQPQQRTWDWFHIFPWPHNKIVKSSYSIFTRIVDGDTVAPNSKAARIISSIRQEQNILHETYSIRIPLNRRTALDYLDPKSPRQE